MTLSRAAPLGQAGRRLRLQDAVQLAAVSAELGRGAAEAVLTAARVVLARLARNGSVLAALGFGAAVGLAPGAAVGRGVAAVTGRPAAGAVGARTVRAAGVRIDVVVGCQRDVAGSGQPVGPGAQQVMTLMRGFRHLCCRPGRKRQKERNKGAQGAKPVGAPWRRRKSLL